MARQIAVLLAISNLGFGWLVTTVFLAGGLKKRSNNTNITKDMLQRRMLKNRDDLLTGLLQGNGDVSN